MRADMAAEIAQVLVGPGRPDLAVETWLGMLAVPAHAETVAVGGGGRFQRPLALYNQRVCRGGDILLQRDGFAAIGYPAAHFAVPGQLRWGRFHHPRRTMRQSDGGRAYRLDMDLLLPSCHSRRPPRASTSMKPE